jgi:hypothetical protein
MSRKLINLAAAATIAVASLASQAADARGFGGFGGGFGRVGGFGGGMGRMGGGGNFGGRFASFTGHGGRIVPNPIPIHFPIVPPNRTPVPLPIPVHIPIVPGPIPVPTPGPTPGPNPGPGPVDHHHHHHHWAFVGGIWVVIDDVTNEVVVADAEDGPAPGPCTCLTKSYTPSGLVVFADVCTKESASASVYGNATADATQVPTTPVAATAVPMSVVPTTPDYAGRTYDDYLAANPQLTQPQASAPQATQKN